MNPEAQRELFFDALEIPAAEREAWIRQRCGDSTIATEVLRLLEANDEAGFFLEPGHAPDLDSLRASEEFPEFDVLHLIGSGGHGDVYLARERGSIEREVAIKVLKCEAQATPAVQRFHAERKHLARLDHPGIATIFRAGTTTAGRPFFAMEYVPGLRITEYADQRKLSLIKRLELLEEVCRAVGHAHQKGVIHGDIKPGNILVAEEQDCTRPRIIDFGIAHTTEEAASRSSRPSGTPAYMSPEQADPELPTDTRTDVFGLGATLYELLAGCPPHDLSDDQDTASLMEHIRRAAIPGPSERVREAASAGSLRIAERREQTSASRLARRLEGDLDTICMRALACDPDDRYPTVQALCNDVRAYLSRRPIQSRAADTGYVMRRLLQRNFRSLLIGMAILVGSAGLWITLRDAEESIRSANRQAESAAETARISDRTSEEIATFLMRLIASASPDIGGKDLTVADMLRDGVRQLEALENADRKVAAPIQIIFGRTFISLGLPLEGIAQLRAGLGNYRTTGASNRRVDSAKAALAGALMGQGDTDGARRLVEEIAPRYHHLGSDPSPEEIEITIRIARLRALLEQANGAIDRARSMVAAALEKFEGLSRGSGEYVALLRTAAAIESDLGEPERAIELLERALKTHDYGQPTETELLLLHLANSLLEHGRIARAETVTLRVVRSIESRKGAEHPALANPLAVLARVEFARGSREQAVELLRRGHQIRRKADPASAATDLAAMNLANALIRIGELEEAEPLLERAVAGLRHRKITNETIVVRTLKSWMALHSARHDLTAVREAAAEAHRVLETMEGGAPLLAAEVESSLALAESRLGEHDSAVERHGAALASIEELRGPDHADTLLAYRNHAFLLQQQGFPERAFRIIEQKLAAAQQHLGPASSAAYRYWAAYAALGQSLKIPESQIRRAHQSFCQQLLETASETSDPTTLTEIGGWLLRAIPKELQDPKAAVPILARAVSASPSPFVPRMRLAEALDRSGQGSRALEMIKAALEVAPQHRRAEVERRIARMERAHSAKGQR